LLRSILHLCAMFTLAVAATASAEELQVVELKPQDSASWGPSALFSPITSLFRGGPAHYFSAREIVIRTTPPGAALDLFYVRRSFQKAFEQGDAPCRLVLPSPSSASEYDTVKVRAFLDGYSQKEISLPVRGTESEVMIELDPLSNSLRAATHLYFADHARVGFLTEEAVVARNQTARDGFSLILLQTAATPDALASLARVTNPLISAIRPQQLGEDLVLRFALTDAADPDAIRNLQEYDAVRRLHRFTVVVEPKDGAGDPVTRAIAALARIQPRDIDACALRYENELRERLEPAALARALDASQSPIARYLRAAMRRLGEISPAGSVTLGDGTVYRTAVPLELSAATSQAADVIGYIAVLRAFVRELEREPYRVETLRGVISPELEPSRFSAVVEQGVAAERACRGSR
jgi:hypothetical protein